MTTADWDEEATEDADEYQAAIVTSDSGVTASQSAFDGGGTSWSASERVAAAESATAGSGAAASRNGAALKSAPDSGGAATKSASDSVASASGGDALTEYASDGDASASDSYAATESASESGYTAVESNLDGGAVPDSDAAQNQNASAFYDTNAPTLGAASDDADTMPPQTAESAPVPEPSDFPQDNATLTSAAPSDTLTGAAASGAYATEESATEDMTVTEAFPLSISVWTLAPDAAPVIMERYPPDAVTDSGIWYALTASEFDELCERFPDIEITSGPEVMDADDLPDGAPAPVDSDAIYIFAPTG